MAKNKNYSYYSDEGKKVADPPKPDDDDGDESYYEDEENDKKPPPKKNKGKKRRADDSPEEEPSSKRRKPVVQVDPTPVFTDGDYATVAEPMEVIADSEAYTKGLIDIQNRIWELHAVPGSGTFQLGVDTVLSKSGSTIKRRDLLKEFVSVAFVPGDSAANVIDVEDALKFVYRMIQHIPNISTDPKVIKSALNFFNYESNDDLKALVLKDRQMLISAFKTIKGEGVSVSNWYKFIPEDEVGEDDYVENRIDGFCEIKSIEIEGVIFVPPNAWVEESPLYEMISRQEVIEMMKDSSAQGFFPGIMHKPCMLQPRTLILKANLLAQAQASVALAESLDVWEAGSTEFRRARQRGFFPIRKRAAKAQNLELPQRVTSATTKKTTTKKKTSGKKKTDKEDPPPEDDGYEDYDEEPTPAPTQESVPASAPKNDDEYEEYDDDEETPAPAPAVPPPPKNNDDEYYSEE